MLFSTFKYALDTCSLTALSRLYPADVFPTAWRIVDQLIQNGIICSCEEVYLELTSQDDGLSDWARARRHMFLPIDVEIQDKVKQVLSTHPTLLDLKKNKSGADPFLIAVASIHKCSLVTEEKPSGGPQRSKIPDVCKAHDIECIPLLVMLRREGLRL